MPEIIYLLTNEAMPTLVKIGRTTDSVESRMTALSSASGVPLAFECHFAAEVKDCAKLEKTLHQLFADTRTNPKREFFKVDPERVVLAISIGEFVEVTPGVAVIDKEEQQALEKAKERRPRINLEALGILPGATLTFSRDENLMATVLDNGKISYQGEAYSLSGAALKILHSLGYKTPSASGSEFWMFEGEILDERRRKKESIQFDGAPSGDA